MSQQDNFVGGFLLGSLVGGVLGGVVGVLATSRIKSGGKPKPLLSKVDNPLAFGEFDDDTEASMEAARLGLEAKIAQLNEAIDEVRQQLGGINGHAEHPWENPSRIDS
ncbi:MAG: hypothetical protein ACFCVD_23420 [Nodosilinea sp.]